MKDIENLKQKNEVVREFGATQTARSIKYFIVPVVLGMLSTGLPQVLFSNIFYFCFTSSNEELTTNNFINFCLDNSLFLLGSILFTILYCISIKWYFNKIYYMFREEYRLVFMCGMKDEKMIKKLATYQMPILLCLDMLGIVIIPQIFIHSFDLLSINWISLTFVFGITYLIVKDMYQKYFRSITGLENIHSDISRVDGKCMLAPFYTVEENIALPYRIIKGEDKKYAIIAANMLIKRFLLDRLIFINVAKLKPVQRILVMILRGNLVAGKNIEVDECMLQNLPRQEREMVERLLNNIEHEDGANESVDIANVW